MRSRSQSLASIALATALLSVVTGLSAIGCGPSAQRVRADETVRVAGIAISEVQATRGADDVARAPLARAGHWLAESNQAIEVWGGSGSLAYETAAPCLAASLGAVREALSGAHLAIPPTLEEAEALAQDGSYGRCAEDQQSRAQDPEAQHPAP
jgi:hypothetical protein